MSINLGGYNPSQLRGDFGKQPKGDVPVDTTDSGNVGKSVDVQSQIDSLKSKISDAAAQLRQLLAEYDELNQQFGHPPFGTITYHGECGSSIYMPSDVAHYEALLGGCLMSQNASPEEQLEALQKHFEELQEAIRQISADIDKLRNILNNTDVPDDTTDVRDDTPYVGPPNINPYSSFVPDDTTDVDPNIAPPPLVGPDIAPPPLVGPDGVDEVDEVVNVGPPNINPYSSFGPDDTNDVENNPDANRNQGSYQRGNKDVTAMDIIAQNNRYFLGGR